ncbi:hypothetical protein HanRHA438_Chr12g0556231 [Helianthus annuus]|nr:hypothetical protein HanRHA438_Chr12g0556231 [Helianthus annuus]
MKNTSCSVREFPKVERMTMTGLFVGFQKGKEHADWPGIPIGQPAQSDSLSVRLGCSIG